MKIPLELTFRGFEPPQDLDGIVRMRAKKLDRFHPQIVSCRVAVERPHEHATSGNPYRVRIEMTVPPGHDLIVREEPNDHQLNDELVTVVNAAFAAAERRLRELKRRQNGH